MFHHFITYQNISIYFRLFIKFTMSDFPKPNNAAISV